MVFKAVRNFGKKKGSQTEERQIVKTREEVLAEIISSRRSVRRYLNKPVSKHIIEKIMESVKYTPSAGNYQPWEMIVVTDAEKRREIVNTAFNQEWMIEAPVHIVACVNDRLAGAVYGPRGKMLYGLQAVAAAIQNILLTAESMGLATCWVGAFSEFPVARLLECPEYVRPCAVITLGFPSVKPSAPVKQEKDQYLHFEKYGETENEKKVRKELHPTHMKFS